MLQIKKGRFLQPPTRTELVKEVLRLRKAVDELIVFLRNTDKEALSDVMKIVKEREFGDDGEHD